MSPASFLDELTEALHSINIHAIRYVKAPSAKTIEMGFHVEPDQSAVFLAPVDDGTMHIKFRYPTMNQDTLQSINYRIEEGIQPLFELVRQMSLTDTASSIVLRWLYGRSKYHGLKPIISRTFNFLSNSLIHTANRLQHKNTSLVFIVEPELITIVACGRTFGVELNDPDCFPKLESHYKNCLYGQHHE